MFEYDSVYDDLDPLKKERDPKTRREQEGQDRKPKYIAGLMAAAEKRTKVRPSQEFTRSLSYLISSNSPCHKCLPAADGEEDPLRAVEGSTENLYSGVGKLKQDLASFSMF